ncbi:MAG: hypothetical protein M3065_16430 [Actinomycetota bacterium]|nr:hypothetical protein [Actinomycetota bacterium]
MQELLDARARPPQSASPRGGNAQFAAVDHEGSGECVEDAARGHPGLGLTFLDEHRELVTAEPRRGNGDAQHVANARRRPQELIAASVPEAVIRLEIVEVEEEDGEGAPASFGDGHGVREAVLEQGAIGEPGERMVEGLMAELVLERLAVGDVAHAEDETADRRVIDAVVDHGLQRSTRRTSAEEEQDVEQSQPERPDERRPGVGRGAVGDGSLVGRGGLGVIVQSALSTGPKRILSSWPRERNGSGQR